MFKHNCFFYKNENSTLFKSSNVYFQCDPSFSRGPVDCAFLCIVSLGMSYLATSAMLLLSILAYSCVVSLFHWDYWEKNYRWAHLPGANRTLVRTSDQRASYSMTALNIPNGSDLNVGLSV